MIEYQVVTAVDCHVFEQRVNEALAEGWQLQGGVSFNEYRYSFHNDSEGFDDCSGGAKFCQAMIREHRMVTPQAGTTT